MVQAVAERFAFKPHQRALSELIRPDGTIDWSPWYLSEEEDMGQGGEQCQIVETLVSSLKQLAQERDWQSVLVSSDQFFAWVKHAGLVQISPDVYLLDNPPPAEHGLPRRWETWRPEHRPPRFAMEIVSAGNWQKDYAISPRYDHLGASELVIVDPGALTEPRPHPTRVPLQVYRRFKRGEANERFDRVYQGNGPSYSTELDAYLHLVRMSPGSVRVRVSRDPAGLSLVPTAAERADREQTRADREQTRADREQTRADREQTRADREQARADREQARADAALAENKRLHARLRALHSTHRP